MAVPAPTTQATVQAPTKPASIAAQAAPPKATVQAPAGEAVRLQQPITVVVQRMPEEKKDHSGEFIAGGIGIVGTLLGVVVTIAYTEYQKRKEERAKTDAACNDAYRKLTLMYSFALGFLKHIEAGAAKAKELNQTFVSATVAPYADPPRHISFTSEEINRVKLVVGYEVINALPQIEEIYTAIVGTFQIYSSRFQALQQMATVEEVGEKAVALRFEPKDRLRAQAEYAMMDDLIVDMHDMAEGVRDAGFSFMLKLIEGLANYFNRHQGITLTKPDGVVETFEWKLERKGKGKKI